MSDSEDDVEFEKETFVLGPITLNIMTISFLPIHKLMQLNSSKTEISGQKLWCGSLAICEYLLYQNANFCIGKYIIELGAGTGVCSMICSKLGATKVVLTDHDRKSIEHMQQDLVDNHISTPESAEVVQLDWYNPGDYQCLNIPSNIASEKDMVRIVAGDVIYKHALVDPFFSVVKHIVEMFNASVLLCHIPRAGVNQEHVVEAAHRFDLDIVEIDPSLWCRGVTIQYSPKEDYERATLYSITRKC
jgi:predicted nicotinamide N-methyase